MCPVTGKVLNVNEKVSKDPTIVNKSPMKDGWIADVSVDKPEEIGIVFM